MARDNDLTRGFKMKNFLLLETQPGCINWAGVNNAPDRGEVRAIAWHAVGHGADCVSYWQWRSALNGQEQYFSTLVAPDGNPRPAYEEVAQLGEDFQKAGALLDGTHDHPRPSPSCTATRATGRSISSAITRTSTRCSTC